MLINAYLYGNYNAKQHETFIILHLRQRIASHVLQCPGQRSPATRQGFR